MALVSASEKVEVEERNRKGDDPGKRRRKSKRLKKGGRLLI